MINSLLIANRGEIALRVLRTCREMGIRAIAVYSDADRDSPLVEAADLAVRVGASPPAESYLDGERLVAIAAGNQADAVHPGYGFLAENPDFSAACRERGLIFVGPPPEVIAAMANKAEAKRRMAQADVPSVPGYSEDEQDEATLRAEAGKIGFPLFIKAVAGGGGRGIRLVEREEDFAAALESARRQAASAFGDDRMMLERYLVAPRHVEIQVLADTHGNVVHLFERECSAQRRHQKIVEETPSPALDPALREAMGAAAVRAARSIGYVGAGTVEFLLDEGKNFYFLEMNTRLQVEHPVTEMILGLDLVRLQIEVAEGRPLPFSQADLVPAGHAIECR
ncbi:MAG: ATP-grasp domain-containing protein, partial [SAR324 cluster bacterium]|nr:ATP-grasp domain-containing protein [SAR324 cluster bacterium]